LLLLATGRYRLRAAPQSAAVSALRDADVPPLRPLPPLAWDTVREVLIKQRREQRWPL